MIIEKDLTKLFQQLDHDDTAQITLGVVIFILEFSTMHRKYHWLPEFIMAAILFPKVCEMEFQKNRFLIMYL